jgi:hypothetical protein
MEHFVYIYLDPRKPGNYQYGDYTFDYEPLYVGKGNKTRITDHIKTAKRRLTKNNKDDKRLKTRFINTLRLIINEGYEPIYFKVKENLTEEDAFTLEIDLIKEIGRSCIKTGPLSNITEGGLGGIAWEGSHPNKGKTLVLIVGSEKAEELRKVLSDAAKLRVGELNPNYGNRGIKSKLYGKKTRERTDEEKTKIAEGVKEKLANTSQEVLAERYAKIREANANRTEEEKLVIGDKIRNRLKGRAFTKEHKEKIKATNYKALNKGSDELKLSDETKAKLSTALKGRIITEEHREKLRTYCTYDEWKLKINIFISEHNIKNITAYRIFCKENIEYKMPPKPESSFKRHNWSGWSDVIFPNKR